MLNSIGLGDLASVTPAALLSLVILLIFTGQLVPGREMRYWRKAFFSEQQMRLDMQDTGRVVRATVRALPEAPVEPVEKP